MKRFMVRPAVAVGAVLFVFAILYTLLSLVNHQVFRTYCLDLGVYTKAIYDYAHFQFSDSSIFLYEPQNFLGDHFDLYLMIFSPLVWLLGPYTLLVIQIVAVLFGAVGIFLLVRNYQTESESLPYSNRALAPLGLPLAAMVCFLTFFGIWHPLSFDYHSNVVASMLLPWFLLCFRRRRYVWGLVLVVLISIAKETMPLWLFFVVLALMWDYRQDRRALYWLGGYAVYATVYFVIISMVVMPSFCVDGHVLWRYEYMGGSFREMAVYILSHPWQCVVNLFTNFTGDADYAGLKLEWLLCSMASGLLLTCFKPNYLLMLVPMVAMKMLSRDTAFWGITNQYNVEMAPVLVAASFMVLASVRRERWRQIGAAAAVVCTVATTIYTVDTPQCSIRADQLRVFQSAHYKQREFDALYARRLLAQIPDGASVCATTMFVPHLALRDSVYMFPIGLDYQAEYYLLKAHSWCYCEGQEDQIAQMIADTIQWQVLSTDGDLYLLRKRR